jgi:bifunctional DNA-binding transcriptional regulator/antitoxin component of YhaV-PrlF toxin-antitoxin module
MKILKEKSRVYNGKPYFKYKVNIPSEELEKAGFKEGDELEAKVKSGEIKLKVIESFSHKKA